MNLKMSASHIRLAPRPNNTVIRFCHGFMVFNWRGHFSTENLRGGDGIYFERFSYLLAIKARVELGPCYKKSPMSVYNLIHIINETKEAVVYKITNNSKYLSHYYI